MIEIIKNSKMTRGQFDTEFTLKALRGGLDIAEIPVVYQESRKPRNFMITKCERLQGRILSKNSVLLLLPGSRVRYIT